MTRADFNTAGKQPSERDLLIKAVKDGTRVADVCRRRPVGIGSSADDFAEHDERKFVTSPVDTAVNEERGNEMGESIPI